MSKTTDLAYLAGVIDSDGSISINADFWRRKALGRTPVYSEAIAIGQCDRQAVDLLQELFGGTVRLAKPAGVNRRAMYYWGASDKNATRVIRELLPYLRIKRRQADIALKLRALKDRGRIVNGILDPEPKMVNSRWGPLPRRWWRTKPEVLAEYAALLNEIRLLNDSRWPFRGAKTSDSILVKEI